MKSNEIILNSIPITSLAYVIGYDAQSSKKKVSCVFLRKSLRILFESGRFLHHAGLDAFYIMLDWTLFTSCWTGRFLHHAGLDAFYIMLDWTLFTSCWTGRFLHHAGLDAFYIMLDWTLFTSCWTGHYTILFTKITATQNEVALSSCRVRGLYFLAVICVATIHTIDIVIRLSMILGAINKR